MNVLESNRTINASCTENFSIPVTMNELLINDGLTSNILIGTTVKFYEIVIL